MRPVHAPGHSSIQVCNASTYTDFGEGAGPGQNLVPLRTAGAIYSGIYQSQSPNSNAVLANCPTGNCTFAPYQSLGFCSRCANITNSLHLSKTSHGPMLSEYHYTLPNGFSFTTAQNMVYLMNATTGLDLIKVAAADLPLILNFTAISSAGYGTTEISATECALYFCLETYQGTVRDGEFSETRTSVSTASNASTSSTEDFAITPDVCYVNGTQHEKPYMEFAEAEDCIYKINWLSRLAMSNSLSPLLQGKGSLFVSNRPSWKPETLEAVYGTQGNYTDIASVFESLASSLTLQARSKASSTAVTGTTWTVQSFVHVRWPWMIMPGMLVVLSGFFLLITILHTRNQYIWKSSPLALLFSGLTVDASSPLKADPTLKGMEDTSRRMDVWLETSPEGPRLKAVPR